MNDLLSPRLRAAADWVPDGAVVCDVGTDHAYLPAALLREGRIPRAIATDLRTGPLRRAAETVRRLALQERMELRLCSGLDGVGPDEADLITLCGMGGEVIRSILEAAPWTRQGVELILQPQSHQGTLRHWLTAHGYRILRERVAREGQRWYPLLLVTGGEEPLPYSPAAELAGHPLRWVPEANRRDYLLFLRGTWTGILSGLARSGKSGDDLRRRFLEQALRELEQWLSDGTIFPSIQP